MVLLIVSVLLLALLQPTSSRCSLGCFSLGYQWRGAYGGSDTQHKVSKVLHPLQQHTRHLVQSRQGLIDGEDYAGAAGADKFMYRFLAGTWLSFRSNAGDPDSANEVCAKAGMATACSNPPPDNTTMIQQLRYRRFDSGGD